MKTYNIGDELTVLIIGEIGRYAAVVTSVGDEKPQPPMDLDMDRDLDSPWDPFDTKATPSRPYLKLKYDYGRRKRNLKPGEYIVYSFVQEQLETTRDSSDLVRA